MAGGENDSTFSPSEFAPKDAVAEDVKQSGVHETGEAEGKSSNMEDAMKAAADKSPLVMALLHLKFASFLQKAGQHEKAVQHFTSSAELRPSARAYFGRGTCLASLRKRTEAIEALEQALAISPDLVGIHVNLAGVHLALQNFAKAEAYCRQALVLEPGSREAVMNLANALRNLHRREEAIQVVWEHIVRSEAGVVTAPKKPGCVAMDKEEVTNDTAEEARHLEVQDSPPIPTTTHAAPLPLSCSDWTPISNNSGLVVTCLKWGTRYDAAYVNRLYAGVCRHLGREGDSQLAFICFTDDSSGLEEGIEARLLPAGLPLWWGKAYLFSEEAGLDGNRVLFLDLDQIIVGSLRSLAEYVGPFALLATDDIACELANGGYNSSVMTWEASLFFRPIYTRLTKAALKFVHRFDHWLEMNVQGVGLWQQLAPGLVVDYTTIFRGGVCIGAVVDEQAGSEELICEGAFATTTATPTDPSVEKLAASTEVELPEAASVVTFPRSPKPHEVVKDHAWVRRHWLADPDAT